MNHFVLLEKSNLHRYKLKIEWYLSSAFPMASVPSISKMYRTFAIFDLHSVLHFASKIKVYAVHFDKRNYISIPEPQTRSRTQD